MTCRPSLRLRLWLVAATLATLAIVAAGIAAFGLARTQTLAAEAMAAQRRIEAYGNYSARVNDWMLGWLMGGDRPPSTAGVDQATDELDRLIAQDVAAAPTEGEAYRRAAQSMTPARLRGAFGQLHEALSKTPPGTPGGEAAVAFYAAQVPDIATGQIEQETRRRDSALTAMEALRGPFLIAATGVGIVAVIVLLLLYILILRPLFARLSFASKAAETMTIGALPGKGDGHDELGLMLARLRQMAGRIDRRRAQLETIVAERTASLSQANDRLEQIDANRRRFFADVGHELRTPLTVIMGEAELGARSDDPELRASFETILTRAKRLFRRIEDILRVARSESGQLELLHESIRLKHVISAALSDMAPLLKRAGITVTHDLPEMTVAGDREWLRQVFAGLLENAAKYAGRGAQVRIVARQMGRIAQIDFSDDGCGLTAQMEARLFDRFARSEVAHGFGVGLALARWIVETSGGRLEVVPAGKGLHLRLSLPMWEEG